MSVISISPKSLSHTSLLGMQVKHYGRASIQELFKLKPL